MDEQQEHSDEQESSKNTFELNFGIVKLRLNGESTSGLVPYIGKVLLIVGAGFTLAYLIEVYKR